MNEQARLISQQRIGIEIKSLCLKVTAGPVSAWKPNAFDIRMQFAHADMPRKSYTHKNIFVNLFV